jgi:hypothetical protein
MQTICAIVLCGVLAAAAQPSPGSSNVTSSNATDSSVNVGSSVTSVYALSFHPEAGALPLGAIYVCRARIMPGTNTAQSAKGSSTVPGNQSSCALEVPFAWQANQPQPAAMLSYQVDAVGADGRILRSVAREGIALPPSEAGSAAHVELTF